MGSILNSNGGFLRKSKGWNVEGKGKGGGVMLRNLEINQAMKITFSNAFFCIILQFFNSPSFLLDFFV